MNETPTVLLAGSIFQEKATRAVEDDIPLNGCDSFILWAKNIPDPSVEWASGCGVVWIISQEEVDFRNCGSRHHKRPHICRNSFRVADVQRCHREQRTLVVAISCNYRYIRDVTTQNSILRWLSQEIAIDARQPGQCKPLIGEEVG